MKSVKKDADEVPVLKVKGEEPKQVTPVESLTPKLKLADKPKRDLFKHKTKYVVVIISVAATIIAAIICLPLIQRWFAQAPEPAATATVQILVSPSETLASIVVSETLHPTLSPTETFTPAPTALP